MDRTKRSNRSRKWVSRLERRKNGRYFSATNPVELLRLVAMWEFRGDDWEQKMKEVNIVDELIEATYPNEC